MKSLRTDSRERGPAYPESRSRSGDEFFGRYGKSVAVQPSGLETDRYSNANQAAAKKEDRPPGALASANSFL